MNKGDFDPLLAQIEQHIIEGEMRITRLITILDRLACGGHDIRQTCELLYRFEDILLAWMERRETIIHASYELER